MKKKLFTLSLIITLVLLTGCSKKGLNGSYRTVYNIKGIGKVKETYEFLGKGKCVRIINLNADIKDDCTYKFNKDKTKIMINWENKLNKDVYEKYEKIDNKTIKIGTRKYTKIKKS